MICRELLIDFYTSSGNRKPDNIIIFRLTFFPKFLLFIFFNLLVYIFSVTFLFSNQYNNCYCSWKFGLFLLLCFNVLLCYLTGFIFCDGCRDGVSESQFNQVLNIELGQIIEACKFLDESWNPKFTVIVAQKNHHTKFFQPGSPDNVPPGNLLVL